MSGWAEIKDLAAQLKHVQTSESAHYLSDRICVDIVSHLINSGRLQLVRTIDGRTLITNTELFKEIVEEIETHRGRISVLEIAKNLDIEYSIIESCIGELVSRSTEFLSEQCTLVAGELFTKSYIKSVAEEIRDRLEFRGVMSSIELTRIYNITPQFLQSIISEYNGVLFKIQREGDKLYTHLFLDKQRARVSGYLSAIVAPVSLADCGSKLDIPQKVLTSLIESLISSGRLKGSLTAGKTLFVPSCFRRAQDAYITDFVHQNGYIEWSVVQRLGIPDPASYLRSHFPSAIHTKEFTICESTMSQLKSVLADKSSESLWIDVSHYLPQVFGPQEREWLIKPLIESGEFVEVCGYLYLYPKSALLDHLPYFHDFIHEKAVLAAGERKQKNAEKSGGGNEASTRGTTSKNVDKKGKSGGFGGRAREIKTKSVKKKYLRKSSVAEEEEEDEEQMADFYLPREGLLDILTSRIGPDAPVDLVEGILDKLLPQIYDSFLSDVKTIQTQNSDFSKNRDKCQAEQLALTSTLQSIQLLERGCLAVDDELLRGQLLRQLLRSEVSTFVNRLYLLLAQSYDIQWPNPSTEAQKSKDGQEESQTTKSVLPDEITPQERDSLASQLNKVCEGMEKKAAALIQEINACLRCNISISTSGKDVPLDNVFNLCDDLASVYLGLNLSISHLRGSATSTAKRKKQDRTLALEIAARTEHQLEVASSGSVEDPKYLASVTLTGAALFGHCVAGWPLSVHGKLVPQLSAWISKSLSAKTSGSGASYPSAIAEMRASKAAEQLTRLTSLVMEEARQKTDEMAAPSLSAEEKKELVANFVATASRCLKAMRGNSTS